MSGEISLHSDNLYIQFSQSSIVGMFMWRTCRSRKDHVGKGNQWMPWEALNDLAKVAKIMKAAVR